MECEDDFAVRDGAFEEEKNFNAEIRVVVEMDDVRRQFREESFDLPGEASVLVGEFEPVETAG